MEGWVDLLPCLKQNLIQNIVDSLVAVYDQIIVISVEKDELWLWCIMMSCFSPQGDSGDLGLPGAVGEKVGHIWTELCTRYPHIQIAISAYTIGNILLHTAYLCVHICAFAFEVFCVWV